MKRGQTVVGRQHYRNDGDATRDRPTRHDRSLSHGRAPPPSVSPMVAVTVPSSRAKPPSARRGSPLGARDRRPPHRRDRSFEISPHTHARTSVVYMFFFFFSIPSSDPFPRYHPSAAAAAAVVVSTVYALVTCVFVCVRVRTCLSVYR